MHGPDPRMQIDLQFIADVERFKYEKPYRISDIELEPDDDIELTNIEFETHSTTVFDLRESHERLKLEQCGFQYIDFVSKTTPGFDDASISAYAEEAIELLQRYVAAEKTICYDLRVRANNWTA